MDNVCFADQFLGHSWKDVFSCRKLESPASSKSSPATSANKAHSLVAASSFHDWIVSDREADIPSVRPASEYFRNLRVNGSISEIEPSEE